MRNFLTNVFQQSREKKILRSFHNIEDKVISIISEIEKKHKTFSESLDKEESLSQNIDKLQFENQNIKVKDFSLDKKIERKRLKFMKWFAIFIEALLSYNAINLFLKETIGLSLASGSEEANGIVTMAKSMLVAIPVAGLLLIGALYFKHNDETKYADKKGIKSYWYKFSWILTILIIPFLNIFIVLDHPGHKFNIIWIFFSIVTFLINVKLVTYSTQFHQMQIEELKKNN